MTVLVVIGLVLAAFVCGSIFGKSLLGGLESRLVKEIHAVPAAVAAHPVVAAAVHPPVIHLSPAPAPAPEKK